MKFGDFASFRYGKMPIKKKITESGKYPIYSGYRYVGFYDEYNTEADQLIIVARGVGGTGDVKLTKDRCYLTNLSIAANIDSNVVLPEYLYYYFKPRSLRYLDSGSAQSQITISDLERVIIPIPPLSDQKAICSYLKLLDVKIQNNKNINENLEQQIEAIFNNKYAPSLCSPNWVVGTIGDVVTLQRGYDLPKDKMVSGSYPVAGSTDTIFYHNEYTTEAPCVVMGRSGNIGKPRLYMERCWAHNTTLFVKDFKGNNPYWSYYMLRSIDYSQFRGGSAVPTLNRNHVHSFEISIPPVSQQNEFAEIILPLLLLIENNRKEIKRLSTLREALLPKLMAGEFDVSNIQL